jgi:putative ABC transport system ATP-binding protein
MIEIDGVETRHARKEVLRSQISIVRQGEIFHGSLMDNLTLGRPGLDVLSVKGAMASVGLLDEVLKLPEGLATTLSTGGLPLSPGQAIRLMFARAVLEQPRLLLVDELLDHIDDVHQRETLLETLFAPGAPWTLLVASSSESVLARCETVYRLESGVLHPMKAR